jgi:hypothetical protein
VLILQEVMSETEGGEPQKWGSPNVKSVSRYDVEENGMQEVGTVELRVGFRLVIEGENVSELFLGWTAVTLATCFGEVKGEVGRSWENWKHS